jgi:hypothetical protein
VTAAVALLGTVVGLLGVLVVGLLRSHAEVLRRLHELGAGVYDDGAGGRPAGPAGPDLRTRPGVAPPRPGAGGTAAHDIAGVGPTGEAVAVGIAGAPHATLVAFLSSGCATCAGFWQAFATGAGVAGDLPAGTRLVIVTRGPEDESASAVRRLAPAGATTVMSTAAFDDYGVPVSPYVVLVDGPGERVIGEGAAATWPQVADLLRRAAADLDLDLDLDRDLDPDAGPGGPAAPRPAVAGLDSRRRDALAESELRAAGIGPGHPSLYPDGI